MVPFQRPHIATPRPQAVNLPRRSKAARVKRQPFRRSWTAAMSSSVPKVERSIPNRISPAISARMISIRLTFVFVLISSSMASCYLIRPMRIIPAFLRPLRLIFRRHGVPFIGKVGDDPAFPATIYYILRCQLYHSSSHFFSNTIRSRNLNLFQDQRSNHQC